MLMPSSGVSHLCLPIFSVVQKIQVHEVESVIDTPSGGEVRITAVLPNREFGRSSSPSMSSVVGRRTVELKQSSRVGIEDGQ